MRNITKRGILSIILITAMAFSLISFASCTKTDEEAEQTITVNVKIVGLDAKVLWDSDVQVTAVPSKMTVLTATQRACEIEGIECVYNESEKMVTKIGEYENQSATSAQAAGDTEEGETTEEITTQASTGLFWYLILNDIEAASSDTIKDGDKISWSYVDLAIAQG